MVNAALKLLLPGRFLRLLHNRPDAKVLLKKKVVRDFFSIAGANLALKPIQILKGFLIAKYLGPAEYGILRAIELIPMLNKFGSLGFKTVALREISSAMGREDSAKAQLVRNNAYSCEFLLSVLLMVIGIVSSLFVESKTIAAAVIIASVGLFVAKVDGIFTTEANIQRSFRLFSRVILIAGFVNAIAVIITVPYAKIYAVLIFPILTTLLGIAIYLRKLKFSYRFSIDMPEFYRQVRIGLPMTLTTLSYGGYRYLERIFVGVYLGKVSLGFYGLAMMILSQLEVLFLYAVKVRKIQIFESLGAGKIREVRRLVRLETLLLTLTALLIVPVAWFGSDYVIRTFLPNYEGAIMACRLMAFALPLKVFTSYINIVIVSPYVNKQSVLPGMHVVQIAFLAIATLVLRHFGHLDLTTFVICDLLGYSIYHLGCYWVYKKNFLAKIRIEK